MYTVKIPYSGSPLTTFNPCSLKTYAEFTEPILTTKRMTPNPDQMNYSIITN